MEENKKVEIIGEYGATLSVIEVGLGSLLHGFHIPFSGIFLSLNQGFILCRAAIFSRDFPKNTWTTYSISNVAAVLKSLSPAGKKLGPMLSLSMQGLLFNLGLIFFGTNLFGLCAGMALLSIWAFIQPLVTYYLFFGEKLFSAAEYMFKKTVPYHGLKAESVFIIFAVIVAIKISVAILLALIAWKRGGKSIYGKDYDESLFRLAQEKGILINAEKSSHKQALWNAFKDLFRPLFLISLLLTGTFLYFSQGNYSSVGFYLLRPLAIGFIFFYLSRTLTIDRWLMRLEGGRFHTFSQGCQSALAKIRRLI